MVCTSSRIPSRCCGREGSCSSSRATCTCAPSASTVPSSAKIHVYGATSPTSSWNDAPKAARALGVWMANISVARRAVAAQMARPGFPKKKRNVFLMISWRSWWARRYSTSRLDSTRTFEYYNTMFSITTYVLRMTCLCAAHFQRAFGGVSG